MNFRKTLALSLLAPAFMAAGAFALSTPRHNHAVTLLPDGNILVTGGNTAENTYLATAEMWDMTANAWSVWGGGLGVARSSHTATLMSDGRVLVAGGFTTGGTPTGDLRICDPLTRTCADAGVDMAARGGHTATLLSAGPRSGHVLLCGGQTTVSSASITGSCETFDPVAGALSPAASMASSRIGHVALLLRSGKIFVSGGGRPGGPGTEPWIFEPTNEMYDPVAGTWNPVDALLQGRINHTATVLNNGKIMIAGGYNGRDSMVCLLDPDGLDEDCWHLAHPDAALAQGVGSKGYLDGAEFFDQDSGARVTLMEDVFNLMPYRVARHSAVLETDGRWRLHRGYGNIFPTFFNFSPGLAKGGVLRLSPTADERVADILPTSTIGFPLDFNLSRPVSGRLVDAEIFFSPPTEADDPSIKLAGAEFYIGISTARADGYAVGKLIDETYSHGRFSHIINLTLPLGTASFLPVRATSQGNTVSSSLTLPGPIYPESTGDITGGTLQTSVRFWLPYNYQSHVMGTARIDSAAIMDPGEQFTISLTSGSAAFDIQQSGCDYLEKLCLFTAAITFSNIEGELTNLTLLDEGTTFYTGLMNIGVKPIEMGLELSFTADEVHVMEEAETTYDFDRSTMVVREMIFSNNLTYVPATNRWGDLNGGEEGLDAPPPTFDHTAIYTPAGDTVLLGGRNCEATPFTDCRHDVKHFLAGDLEGVLIPVVEGSWLAGPSLLSRRAAHTSTVLADGSILTCGGSDGTRPLDSCERMDPGTMQWKQTGPMTSPRSNHTATLLPNGNVLAAGGIVPGGTAVATAELYFPETGTWVRTSSMTHIRQLHTATLMPDGNVLVTGGATASTYSATAEIYITSAAHWVPGGALVEGRSQHTATLLKSGNVLLAGGVNGFGAMRQTEIYDYLARASAAADDLAEPRYGHTASLLRDGRVVVAGGSDNIQSLNTSEIFDGANWYAGGGLTWHRANHRAALLPNGKLMLTGGEVSGAVRTVPEGFDPDFNVWSEQGQTSGRSRHTLVMTRDNKILNIGGWDGAQYLDTTEYVDFNFDPDSKGLASDTTRQATISDATPYFNQGSTITLLSATTDFHGVTEASGGGAGSRNSSHSNPRVYLQQIDNPSGFMIDLSTRIYSRYMSPETNPVWSRTTSSITIKTPDLPGEMPHGWYHLRVAANGVFSMPFTVQVTTPRPAGLPAFTSPAGTVLGTSSITWTWNRGTIPEYGADGFAIYAASNSVFITTLSFVNGSDIASYTQTGMAPNTPSSVMVAAYNQGGYGALARSSTHYTLALPPSDLEITDSGFENITLEWDRQDNTLLTRYELSMQKSLNVITPDFSVNVSTPVAFEDAFTGSSYTITGIEPNYNYYVRARARNGDGVLTAFSDFVSTITVGQVLNVQGVPLSGHEINWSWMQSGGADYYELFDISDGTETAVLISSPVYANSYTQTGISTNTPAQVVVYAVKTVGGDPVKGTPGFSPEVYTFALAPLPWTFTNISTGSLALNWLPNGNPPETNYWVELSSSSDFSSSFVTEVKGLSTAKFYGLIPNTRYYGRVRARNGDDVATAIVSLGSRYTLAQPPILVTAPSISMSGVTLTWSGADNSDETFFEVRSSTSSAFVAVSTHIPFSALYNGDNAFISGLLTSTSYYFDVAAINGEGVITPRTQCVPLVYTSAGPAGTPSGAVGGTSDPNDDTTIAGTLPNGHTVSIFVPQGSFQARTGIAIASHSVALYGSNPCGQSAADLPTLVFDIYSEGESQPFEPVSLTIGYGNLSSAQISQINQNISKLVLARYNPVSGQCLPLETVVDQYGSVNGYPRTIRASLNHFSVFQLIIKEAAANLEGTLIYPNPFYPNRGQGFVTFTNMPSRAKATIYTISGTKVWEGTATGSGVLVWRGVNESNVPVGSGVYFVSIKSSSGDKIFKLAVER